MSTPERLSAALADRYHIERELGAGGMATVYLAEDLKHKRKVALKVLKPELAAVLGADRFVQEITTTASLQHPHILPLFDSGTADGFLYYVMPFIEGETLRDKLTRETQLGVDEALRIAGEVADALAYAHGKGVIHRDIKPENILIQNGRPMVADFGIALAVSAAAGGRMTETGLSLGTPHYMSPEQATADKEITGRSDVYSLASVLYEMLAGVPPHEGGSAQQVIMRIIADTPRPVRDLRKTVPPNVAAALARALEKLPADRFDSARAFADALNDRHFGEEAAAAAGAPQHVAWRWPLVAGLLLGGFGGAAAVLLNGGETRDGSAVSMVQRTFARQPILNARWTADARTIIYTADFAAPRMYIIRPEYPESQPFGPERAHLLAVSSTNEVALLINPRYINQRLYTGTLARMSVDGGAAREVLENVQEADWSPDGTQLAITRNMGDRDQLEYPVGKVVYQGPPGGYLSDLRVSADGKRVAFFEHPIRYDDRGWVVIADTTRSSSKSKEEFGGLEGLAWDADDQSVLFSAANNGPYEVNRLRSDRTAVKALPNAGRLTMFDARGGRWLISRDDTPWWIVARLPGNAGLQNVSWLDGSISPGISGDGTMIGFTDQGMLSGAMYGVMARKTDGSPAVRLGDGNAVAISHDGRWIIGSLPTSPPQFRLYPTGAGAHRALSWPALENVSSVAFFRDGSSLLVCGKEPGKPNRCYRAARDSSALTPIGPDSTDSALIRPDGNAIAVRHGTSWWIYPIAGGSGRPIPGLTNTPVLRWSPDGAALWVRRPGPAGVRGVDRFDLASGRRSPIMTIEELPGGVAPFSGGLNMADDPNVYVYWSSSYTSLLFSVEGLR